MAILNSYCITLTFAVASGEATSLHSLTLSIDVGAVQLLMLLQSTDPGKRTLSLTILLGKQVLGFSIILMTHGVQVNPSAYQLIRPYELLLEANAVILGPHVAGKVMLILQESLGCNTLQLAACLRWNNGSHAAAIRSLALATRNVTIPLTVEYLTPANDASGRLYATQICAQRLPRELRLLMYGSNHKEVDLTGAHYELIRAMTGSVTLPPNSSP